MKVGEGEATRTILCEISTTNPVFPLTGLSMGGAKVLSTTNLDNESTKNPDFSFFGSIYGRCASSFDVFYLLYVQLWVFEENYNYF